MTSVAFTPAAVGDLDGIWDYTVDQWGERRAIDYTLAIRAACRRLALGEMHGRSVGASHGLLRYVVASHVVFYRPGPGGIEVIRILHVRQDPDTQLGE
ncbi:MAG: type II toxin-antitoxin system RelE/ParE family toxin [Rhodobacteraceae bacterium]|nr:type II toxin-antitoxin system RelE/ParE family toxin [Paracoccaceae bacterium]MCZ8082356.1 type II toxin-antitoxin system RelE/ParE family toxin [Paracoccaceae bacterium]